MGDGVDEVGLLALAGDPDLKQPLGEYAAAGKVLVIGLQSVQRLIEVGGRASILAFSSSERSKRLKS